MAPSKDGLAPERIVPGRSAEIGGSFQLLLRDVRRATEDSPGVLLGARDYALLQALDQYRYLDTRHLRWLFFASERKAQERLRLLAARGLVSSWRATLSPGRISRPTVHLLAAAGARELARHRAEDSRPIVKRAAHAAERSWNVVHDLEANGFFAGLAATSRDRAAEGLYHWLGPAACRLVSKRERLPPSDGWGRYLVSGGEVRLHLEWDRGTERVDRLGTMAAGYARYFAGRLDADRRHVLFVVPSEARERETDAVLARVVRSTTGTCRLWTSTVEVLRAEGPLGQAWLAVGGSEPRRPLNELPAASRIDLRAADSIGKPTWWERRPAGGEGA